MAFPEENPEYFGVLRGLSAQLRRSRALERFDRRQKRRTTGQNALAEDANCSDVALMHQPQTPAVF